MLDKRLKKNLLFNDELPGVINIPAGLYKNHAKLIKY